MPKRRYLPLTDEEHIELEHVRDHHPKAYVRERAAILLKIADGMAPHRAAQEGGLKPHQPKTIYRCLARYEREGVAGLEVKPGRGRKPAFSPSVPE